MFYNYIEICTKGTKNIILQTKQICFFASTQVSHSFPLQKKQYILFFTIFGPRSKIVSTRFEKY